MRVPNATHQRHPWVIETIAPDFTLLDAWALPIEGTREDLESAFAMLASFDPAAAESPIARALFSIRLWLGARLGWDDPMKKRAIPGCTETTLSDRLPDELRGTADGAPIGGALKQIAGGFVPLYRTDDEFAAEISNATMHGVLHLAGVDQGDGRYRAQLGVYVKPRGWPGDVYLKFIEPFRHLIVYPALMRQIRHKWEARAS